MAKKNYGNYCTINGVRVELEVHPTDFSVQAAVELLSSEALEVELQPTAANCSRVRAKTKTARDATMGQLRSNNVAHHVYLDKESKQEFTINDRVFLRVASPEVLQEIKEEHNLVDAGMMGRTHVLKVTNATGRNPIKTANMIDERDDVEYCSPQLMVEQQPHQTTFASSSVLFREQWYLSADTINHPDVDPRADIEAPEAWQITMGDPDIVIAVMDDGVDLGHPGFSGKAFDPNGRDFDAGDNSPVPESGDFHGTPVASIAGAPQGNAMVGVAPGCTVMPIRIGFGPLDQQQTLNEFRFASRHADVLNCSFGFPPLRFPIFDRGFVDEIEEMTRTGGRRSKGLVVVFSAGNDDAPTRLSASKNTNGVRFLGGNPITGFFVREIPAGKAVVSAYPSIPGTVVVASLSSMNRKSGYSNWGPEITVTAPSSNSHELRSIDRDFRANYRGLGQVAATNRPGHGRASRPLRDDPTTPNVREDFYTDDFGGTSGAAPVVSGIAGLMLSINPDLTADEVRSLLMATADRDMDLTLDLASDPNLQGLTGEFNNGRSLFFGSGKVNARKAVARAKALVQPSTGHREGTVRPNLAIPDNQPRGVVSAIDITGAGEVTKISVDLQITHTYRGDLIVTLISPQGFTANLHRGEGGRADDLIGTYTSENNSGLALLASGGVDGKGLWRLHVVDRLSRDTGTLEAWSLKLT
ncbi:MAG: S8 family serine peptidase [Planctomycetota bacterium]